MNTLQNIDLSIITIFYIPESQPRKAFHQYLESKFPHLPKSSVLIKYLSYNEDEYYAVECTNCDSFQTIDCRDLDGVPKIRCKNNAVIIGDYLKGYTNKKNNDTIDINKIIDTFQVCTVEPPLDNLNKKKLGKYISNFLLTKECLRESDHHHIPFILKENTLPLAP